MDLEQDIKSLVKASKANLRETSYSEARISDYQGFWQNGVVTYTEKHSIVNYNTDVGERFLTLTPEKGGLVPQNIHSTFDHRSIH